MILIHAFILSLARRSKKGMYTGVGKSTLKVVHMEKGMQVMIITRVLLTQKNVIM